MVKIDAPLLAVMACQTGASISAVTVSTAESPRSNRGQTMVLTATLSLIILADRI
jgi:hypothetical protein